MTRSKPNAQTILWTATILLFFGLIFSLVVFSEYAWLSAALGAALIGTMVALVLRNRAALKGRAMAYGTNSLITVLLVISIVGVLNFLGNRYPLKADLTKNKVHTLSDQTVKLVKGLDKPLKATLFATAQQKEAHRPLLESYKALNPKFETEFVDPTREPTRTRSAGIKKDGTLELRYGARDTKVEELTEEKITNSMIKILKDRSSNVCFVTGHGEKSIEAQDAEGYSAVKQALTAQAYETKSISLVQDLKDGKIPADCDAIAVLGASKAFFPPEIKAINEYLDNGGRAIFALDINLKGGEGATELVPVLESWGIKPVWGLIVDPVSRLLGVDATVPVIANFNKEHAITKEFGGNCFFPFSRPLEAAVQPPAGLTVKWLAQSTPKSWSVGDPKVLSQGTASFQAGRDKQGPLSVAIASSGKKAGSKATRESRIVAFGSSIFAVNNFIRYGNNLDLFVNSASWVLEDESLISIRSKESETGKIELSNKSGSAIFLLTVILLPALAAITGAVIWFRRRKL